MMIFVSYNGAMSSRWFTVYFYLLIFQSISSIDMPIWKLKNGVSRGNAVVVIKVSGQYVVDEF